MKTPLLIIIFCVLVAAEVKAASYYVAKTGLDTNPGTEAQPFLTVQKGMNTAVAGDTVLVGAGTYAEVVQTARGGTRGKPIVLNGQGVAIINAFVTTHSNVYLFNSTLAGKASGVWLLMGKGGHFCIVSNNVFDGEYNTNMTFFMLWDNPYSGELPFGTNCASGALVISNTFTRGEACTVIQMFGDTNVVIGNRILDNDNIDPFHLWGRSNSIIANVVSNIFVSPLDSNHPDMVQTYGLNGHGGHSILIESNIFMAGHDQCQTAMFEGQNCLDLHSFTFRNNLFMGISRPAMIGVRNVQFLNNTFYKCNTNLIGGPGGPVLLFGSITNDTYTNFVASSGHGGQVLNNVFLDCGGLTNTSLGWYTFETQLTNVAADYNYVGKNNYQPVDLNTNYQAVGDAGGWGKTTWWEPHGINGGNPLFVNESGFDFRLQNGSPLIAAATNLQSIFNVDIAGTVRGVNWDIGAFEFVPTVTVRVGNFTLNNGTTK